MLFYRIKIVTAIKSAEADKLNEIEMKPGAENKKNWKKFLSFTVSNLIFFYSFSFIIIIIGLAKCNAPFIFDDSSAFIRNNKKFNVTEVH